MDATNLVVLRGVLSSESVSRTLPSGAVLTQLNITTPHVEGARSVPVVWFDPPAAVAQLAAGSEVVVVGHVRRRFFRSGGSTQSRTEVVGERLALGSRRRDIERLLESVVDKLATSDLGVAPRSRSA